MTMHYGASPERLMETGDANQNSKTVTVINVRGETKWNLKQLSSSRCPLRQ